MPAYDLFASTELLGEMALERMMAKLSTRRYPAGLEPVGRPSRPTARSTSKSAVTRRFVAATESALADMLAADLSGLDLVALMIDGVHFAEHLCVVALGHRRRRHQASPRRGRGLDREHHRGHRPARRAAGPGPGHHPADPGRARRRQGPRRGGEGGVRPPGHPSLPAAQGPQRRDQAARGLRGHGGEEDAGRLPRRPALEAEAPLEALARDLDKTHPGAAGSLREGLAETLTVIRLGVPPTLARTLRSTNAIESMIEICRDHSTTSNAGGTARWRCAGAPPAWSKRAKQFRRVNGHLHLPALRAALDATSPPKLSRRLQRLKK